VPPLRDDNAVSRRSPAFIFEQKSGPDRVVTADPHCGGRKCVVR
jgi:hypothetical protein